MNISKELQGKNSEIANHLKNAINDARKKLHEEKLREWKVYMKENDEDDEIKGIDEAIVKEYDPIFNPDETACAPEIFDDFPKFYEGLNKKGDFEEVFKNILIFSF
jgi:hypothetical protein